MAKMLHETAIAQAVDCLDVVDVRNLLMASDLVIEEDFGNGIDIPHTSMPVTITFDIAKFRTMLKELLAG